MTIEIIDDKHKLVDGRMHKMISGSWVIEPEEFKYAIDFWRYVLGDDYRDKYHFDYPDENCTFSGGGGNCLTYDLALKDSMLLTPEYPFALAVVQEHMTVPLGWYLDVRIKSTSARLAYDQPATITDNGWYGYLTLELSIKTKNKTARFPAGLPLIHVVAQKTPFVCDRYNGKYQNQPQKAIGAR